MYITDIGMRFAYNFLRRHGVGANKQNKKRNTTMKRMLKGFTLELREVSQRVPARFLHQQYEAAPDRW